MINAKESELLRRSFDAISKCFILRNEYYIQVSAADSRYRNSVLRTTFASMRALCAFRCACREKSALLVDRRENQLKLRAWRVLVGCYESAERLHAIEAAYSDLEQKYIKHEALMALFFALK